MSIRYMFIHNYIPICMKTKIRKEKNGQYRVTVPVGIADAMDLDGEKVEWSIESSTKLSMKVVDDE